MTEAVMSAGAELRHRLRDLYEDYFGCLDDQDVAAWPDFFTEDGFYLVQSAESRRAGFRIGDIFCDGAAMMRDRAMALRKTSVYEPRLLRHFAGTLRIRAATETVVRAEAGFLVLESLADEAPQVFAVGRSEDEIVPAAGGLRFRRRIAVYDHSFVRNTLVFPL